MTFEKAMSGVIVLGVTLAFSAGLVAKQPQVVPGRWIVELEDAPTLEFRGGDAVLAQAGEVSAAPALAATAPSVTGQARFDVAAPAVLAYADHLDVQRGAVLERARKELGFSIQPDAVFRHVMNGFSVRLSDAEAARLATVPGVRAVHPELIFQPELAFSVDLIGARDLANGLPGFDPAAGEGTVIGIIDSGINWDHLAFSDEIDGFTFTNPYGNGLGTCANATVQCNNKLVGVYNFADEGTLGKDGGGHGTHVAATAAGVEWATGLAGVAPRANIISYKVCYEQLPDDPDSAGCALTPITQAFEQAVADGVDVVNFSIGLADGPSPWIMAYGRQVLNLRDAGITFVTSAGNEGPDYATISYPADAPWAFTVGSSTHARRTGRRILISGVGAWFITYGSGPDLPTPTITGADLVPGSSAGGSMLGCSAFPGNAFADGVALLERGDCNFSVKVNHAANAGARAVVMINNVPGAPIVMGGLEGTSIPAGMISQADGAEILAAIDAAGQPLAVNMPTAVTTVTSETFQDQVSPFSSRGPTVHATNLMKPNVMAPGQAILAAYVPSFNSQGTLSGTSMASPHVAGAVAQLRQLHPSWTPTMLQNALETTAETEPMTNGGRSADFFERGAGRIRVERAASAALFLPVTRAQFLAADPATGGNPGSLNLPGILNESCQTTCATTRTVEAIQSGTWTVETTGDLAISVSPGSFSLQPGQRQQLSITLSMDGAASGELRDGLIRLVPASSSQAVQTLTAAALKPADDFFDLPAVELIEAEANRGSKLLSIPAAGQMAEAVFNTSALVRPVAETFNLAQDPDRNNPFSNTGGTRTFLVDVPAGALMFYTETVASQSPDIDLFVGRDSNGDGQAQLSELVCESMSSDQFETCAISNPEPGRWWILVQNWQASSASAQDRVDLEYAVLTHAPGDYSLAAAGPGRHEGGPLDLRLSWDQPGMRKDERWIGAVGVSPSPDALAGAGAIPVIVTRTGPNTPQLTALVTGETTAVVLPPNSRHEKLFVDVPFSSLRVSLNVQGDGGVTAGLQPNVYGNLAGWAPDTPPPPPGMVVSGTDSAAGIEVFIGDILNPPTPARYYVILENTTNQERKVNVTVDLNEDSRMNPRFGLWSPQSRTTFQGIEWQRDGDAFMTWYSYDEEGLPAFYIAIAPINMQTSVWQAPLYRVTSNQQRQSVDVVGEVSLTTINSDRLVFSWRLNGAHGSEIMVTDAPQTCPTVGGEPASYTGHWFSPGRAVGGTTALYNASNQFYVRYFFDNDGVGRWIVVPGFESDGVFEAYEFRGFCPNCESFPMDFETDATLVGSYAIEFSSENTGVEVLDVTLDAPLNHSILLDVPVQKLSARLTCWP